MEQYPIYGQKRVIQLLHSNIQKNRLAHAYLFYGQTGVGKDATAIGMAIGLNCVKSQFGGCGFCESCKRMFRYEHPAFRMIFPIPSRPKSMKEEKYQNMERETILARIKNPYIESSLFPETNTLPIIGIDSITGLKREVGLKLVGHRYRVFLISHADRMTIPASNSLLKLLEEPPEGTVLFLTTSTPGRLLSTIVSRCQNVRFDSLAETDIVDALVNRWHFTREKAIFFADLSGGSLQYALDLSNESFQEKRDIAIEFLEACLENDFLCRLSAVNTLTNQHEKLEVIFILKIVLVVLRDLLQLQLGIYQKVFNEDRREQLKLFIEKWTQLNAEKCIKSVQQTMELIQKNVYLPLAIFELSRTFRMNDLT